MIETMKNGFCPECGRKVEMNNSYYEEEKVYNEYFCPCGTQWVNVYELYYSYSEKIGE